MTAASGRGAATAGWRLLLRLSLRQDRVLAGVPVALLGLMAFASAAATGSLYADEQARIAAARALDASPAIVALYGPVLDVTSAGELAMTKLTVLYAVFVAALFVIIVRRHTRVEEESGRSELVGGTAVGRQAPVVATGALVLGWAGVLGVLTTLGCAAGGLDLPGSLAFGGLWAGTALVGAGVGAVTAQLSTSARTCGAWAAAAVGALYLLRAVGDTAPERWSWLSRLTPFGWNTRVAAFGDTRWWLLAAYPALAAVLVALAWWLRGRRDLGSGVFRPRPGPERAGALLRGAGSLALRLHAAALVVWSVAALALGAVFGAIVPGIGDLLDSASARAVIDELGGQLVAALLSVLVVVVGHFAATVTAHAARDEGDGRAEAVLATAVGRGRWFAVSAALALLGTGWLLLATGVGLQVGYALADGPSTGSLVLAALAWVPAAWLVAALGVLTAAVSPRWSAGVWAWPGGFLTLTVLADSLSLPRWVGDLSPYAHVPALPSADWSWSGSLGLAAVALVVLGVSWWRLRSRDIG